MYKFHYISNSLLSAIYTCGEFMIFVSCACYDYTIYINILIGVFIKGTSSHVGRSFVVLGVIWLTLFNIGS